MLPFALQSGSQIHQPKLCSRLNPMKILNFFYLFRKYSPPKVYLHRITIAYIPLGAFVQRMLQIFLPTKLSLLNIDPKIFQSFQLKQKDGVNDDYVCTLIREDSIEEFVSYFNMSNLPLSATVKQSIFETNPLLCEKSATLIEYSAFYGSIQIFNFMKMNGVELSPSLWIYAIHSRNPEMIHLLEELHVKPEDKTYQSCLKEAIKCHHNEIANYIQDNLLTNYNEKNIVSYCFKFHNFATFPDNYYSNSFFYYFCKFNYLKLVKIFMKYEEIDLNSVFIFKK